MLNILLEERVLGGLLWRLVGKSFLGSQGVVHGAVVSSFSILDFLSFVLSQIFVVLCDEPLDIGAVSLHGKAHRTRTIAGSIPKTLCNGRKA